MKNILLMLSVIGAIITTAIYYSGLRNSVDRHISSRILRIAPTAPSVDDHSALKNKFAVPTTSPNTASRTPSYADVIEAWHAGTRILALSSADNEQIDGWLRRILTIYSHRKIDGATLAAFQESLSQFASNSGADFSSSEHRSESLDVLRFCMEAGWADPGDTENDMLLRSYDDLTHEFMAKAQRKIMDSVPPDRATEWNERIEVAIRKLTMRIDDHLHALNRDFLFPGFKRPLTMVLRAHVLDEMTTWSIIPMYGDPKHQRLLKTLDESFGVQLERDLPSMETFYLQTLAGFEMSEVYFGDKYWRGSDTSFDSNVGFWPVKIAIKSTNNNHSSSTTKSSYAQ